MQNDITFIWSSLFPVVPFILPTLFPSPVPSDPTLPPNQVCHWDTGNEAIISLHNSQEIDWVIYNTSQTGLILELGSNIIIALLQFNDSMMKP